MSVDLSVAPYTCYQGCGFECDMDDYPRQSQHMNWHTVQDNRILTLENMVRTLESKMSMMESGQVMTQISLTAIEKVIGTTGNFRFVEREGYDDHDPF